MKHYFLILLLFFVLTIFITYPLVFKIGSLTTGFGDEMLIVYIQNWIKNAIFSHSFSLFHAPFFYPFSNTLAYSESFITSGLISIIPCFFSSQPICSINATIISSLTLLGFSVYCLVYYLNKNSFVSFLSGVIILFSPAVLDKLVHLQVLTIYFVPFALVFFLRYLSENKLWYLIVSLVCFVLQAYNSFLPGYFILFSYLIIIILFLFQKKHSIRSKKIKQILSFLCISFLIVIPLILPYFQVSTEFSFRRDIRETIHLALQPEDLLYPNQSTRLQQVLLQLQSFARYPQDASYKVGYLGTLFSILVIFSFVTVIRNRKKYQSAFMFLIISMFGLIMSFGPLLHFGRVTIHEPFLIPLPYTLFYYVIPGFQGIRNSSRWEMLFVLAAAVTIGIVLSEILKRKSRKTSTIIVSVLLIGVFIEYNFPMQFQSVEQVKNFPKEYHWLAATPKDTVFIELPIYTWDMQPYASQEFKRLYYNSIHFRRTVNGISGFSPKPWEESSRMLLANFPDPQSIKYLKGIGVDYVIIHADEYDTLYNAKFTVNKKQIARGSDILSGIRYSKALTRIKSLKSTTIYKLN